MAIKPRVTTAAAKPAPAKPATVKAPAPKALRSVEDSAEVENDGDVRTESLGSSLVPHGTPSLSLTRSFTVKSGEDFVKIGVMITKHGDVDDDDFIAEVSAKVTELINSEAKVSMEQYSTLTGREPDEESADGEADPDADSDTTAEPDAEGGEQITAEAIRAMKRAEVETVISEYQLDVDADEFPKTKQGNDALKEAVIAAGGLGDDAEGEEAAPVTADDINGYDREELTAFIEANSIDVDAKKYPKIEKLRAAVIAALPDPEDEVDPDADAGAEPEPEPEPDAEAESSGYTKEELDSLTMDDLKAIYVEWELGKFPTGVPKVQKTAAVKKILATQNGE